MMFYTLLLQAEARLQAVGKDVTFVVQPIDFVELLRKALKSTFGYKEYVVSWHTLQVRSLPDVVGCFVSGDIVDKATFKTPQRLPNSGQQPSGCLL